MKTIFYSTFLFLSIALISCDKEVQSSIVETTEDAEEQASSSQVTVTFDSSDFDTKAFNSSTGTAETWEKSVVTVSIYIFDSANNFILQRNFTSTEVTDLSATFSIPGEASGKTYTFYAVANQQTSVLSYSDLTGISDNSISSYNGTFSTVTSSAVRSNGFIMSGSTTKTLSSDATDLSITLKRSVCKLAITTSTSTTYASRYEGSLNITSATITRSAVSAPVIDQSTYGSSTATVTQVPNLSSTQFQNLFYLYPKAAASTGSRTLLTLYATYDADGSSSTSSDQLDVEYEIELTGEGDGSLLRNGYYKLAITIDGLEGYEVSSSITIADWSSPITQSVNIGN